LQRRPADAPDPPNARRRLLGCCLPLVEHVERPVADGAALQVQELAAEVGAEDYRLDLGGSLLRP
jgi:hypothetical protein